MQGVGSGLVVAATRQHGIADVCRKLVLPEGGGHDGVVVDCQVVHDCVEFDLQAATASCSDFSSPMLNHQCCRA